MEGKSVILHSANQIWEQNCAIFRKATGSLPPHLSRVWARTLTEWKRMENPRASWEPEPPSRWHVASRRARLLRSRERTLFRQRYEWRRKTPRLRSYRGAYVPSAKEANVWPDPLEQLLKQKEWGSSGLSTEPIFLPKGHGILPFSAVQSHHTILQ